MSDKETAPKNRDCPKCGGNHFGDAPGNCPLSADYVPSKPWPKADAVECRAPAPQLYELLEKVVRLTDGVTHKEQINSPLWLLGCEIYDDICEQYDMDELRNLAATPQVTPTYTYSEIDLRRMRRYAEELLPCLNKEYPDPPRGLLGNTVGMLERSVEGTSEQAPQELELEQEADGRWLAEFLRFPGVMAYGKSPEEAIRNAAKVLIESEQASPTPEICPTCGSPSRERRNCKYPIPAHDSDSGYHRYDMTCCTECDDSWHSSPGTTKGNTKD